MINSVGCGSELSDLRFIQDKQKFLMFVSSTLNTVQVKVSQCLTPSRSGKPVTAPPAEDNTQKRRETIILLHTKNQFGLVSIIQSSVLLRSSSLSGLEKHFCLHGDSEPSASHHGRRHKHAALPLQYSLTGSI